MQAEFSIKKGLSTNLFAPDGTCLLADKLELYAWYMTTDTAEVYVCLRENPAVQESPLVLRKINDLESTDSFDPKVVFVNTYKTLPLSDQKIDTIYVVNDENASYRWTGSEYICIGRDYTEVNLIFGGRATT